MADKRVYRSGVRAPRKPKVFSPISTTGYTVSTTDEPPLDKLTGIYTDYGYRLMHAYYDGPTDRLVFQVDGIARKFYLTRVSLVKLGRQETLDRLQAAISKELSGDVDDETKAFHKYQAVRYAALLKNAALVKEEFIKKMLGVSPKESGDGDPESVSEPETRPD